MVVAILLLMASTVPAGEEKRVRLTSDTWPPFTAEAGQRRFAVDLVHEALERSGYAATTTVNSWDKVVAGVRSGVFDGSAAVWRSEAREAFLVFSEPYLENRLVILGRKGSDVSAASLSELAGKRVAVVGRYAYGDVVDEATEVVFVDGESDQANIERLLEGAVDYMLVDELVARYLVENQKAEASKYLEIGVTPLASRKLHFALRRSLPNAETIIRAFDAEIKKMMADGSYNRILRLNWIRADVDGDGRLELVAMGDAAGESPPESGFDVLLPDRLGQDQKGTSRFYIGGKVYDSWEEVPSRFKGPQPGVMDAGASQGVSMFKF